MNTTVTMKEFNRPIVIGAAIFVAVAANVIIAGMPIILSELIEKLGYSEQRIGFVASAYVAGMTVASIICTFLITRINRQLLLGIGIVLSVAGFLAIAMIQTTETLPILLTWSFAGSGQGLCWSLALACLAGSSNPIRNFGFMFVATVSAIGVELTTLPLISAKWGIPAIFYTFAILAGLCIFLIRFWPAYYVETKEEKEYKETHPVAIPSFISLLAILFFYISVNSFWSYAERIGLASGLSFNAVITCLTLGNLASLTSCVIATWIGDRFGMARPLMVTLGAEILIMAAMGVHLTSMTYILGSTLFFMFWNVTDIFQLGSLSIFDHSGRYTVLVPAFQGVGMTIGPAAAAMLLGENGEGYSSILFMCTLSIMICLSLYLLIHKRWGDLLKIEEEIEMETASC